MHPVWITLLIALLVFVTLTVVIALAAHFGTSLYTPMNPIRTSMETTDGLGEEQDDRAVELDEVSG